MPSWEVQRDTAEEYQRQAGAAADKRLRLCENKADLERVAFEGLERTVQAKTEAVAVAERVEYRARINLEELNKMAIKTEGESEDQATIYKLIALRDAA